MGGCAQDDFMTIPSQTNKYNKPVTSEAFVFIVQFTKLGEQKTKILFRESSFLSSSYCKFFF